jgi:hypothetical protein
MAASDVFRAINNRRSRAAFKNATRKASPAQKRRMAETRRRSTGTI